MRILGGKENKMILTDPISGSEIIIKYRTPKSTEIIQYRENAYKTKKGNFSENANYKIEMGMKIITGVGEESFGDENGNPISSTPGQPGYREDWKEFIKENASDIIIVFTTQIFEGARVVEGDSDFLK